MKKRVLLLPNQRVDIIKEYSEQLTPMIELAKKYGVTRQAIYKIVKKAGCATEKKRYPVSCAVCGAVVYRTKARIRRQLHHFCGHECYTAFLRAGNGAPYIENRYHSMIAREKVGKLFALQQGHIVHHEDRNQYNNTIENLRVFATQGDHIRHHRGFSVDPIWDGRYI